MEFTKTCEIDLNTQEQGRLDFIWETRNTAPFNELIVSWNGLRPSVGKWTFFVRLGREGNWSEWLQYAEWNAAGQKTFKNSPLDSFAESYQDAVTAKTGLCDAFSVKIMAEDGADLKRLDSLYACLSDLSRYSIHIPPRLRSVLLKGIPLQSQMILGHPRCRDLCSPTSTSTAINYLLGRKEIDPVIFAQKIHDAGFDIYGNWILNTAEGYQQLGGSHRVFVKRLNGFHLLHDQLVQGVPVVASVKGEIPGAPKPYPFGHLICVTGFEPAENLSESKVYCVDPAFPINESTYTAYKLSDFLKAWGARRNLAYLFLKKT